MGFLYTAVDKVLFGSGVIVSRKDIEPLGLVSSTVNWMDGSTVAKTRNTTSRRGPTYMEISQIGIQQYVHQTKHPKDVCS